MMILKRANRAAFCLSSSFKWFSIYNPSTSNIIETFENMIKQQRFQDVADRFKELSRHEKVLIQSLFQLICKDVFKNKEKWDINAIADIANTISLTEHLNSAEKFYPVLHERFEELNDDSLVKLIHLLTKIPENGKKFHRLYYQKIVPLLTNQKNNPKSFSVALIAFLHLYDTYTQAQIDCICRMVSHYRWSLVPKHCVNILTYSKPPLQSRLMEVLMENISFYAKYDLLITN
ncbi:unnamed protein product [Blepharisma stoltei]|uniref:FAST kinase leucine-rich domain-containing protein n=1 Tax=Blepharisma stoltei TaxID=1481888 RepID=A0AAU9IWH3_9CILI|nr:unnamed protein product [Blepharisma stoltei]